MRGMEGKMDNIELKLGDYTFCPYQRSYDGVWRVSIIVSSARRAVVDISIKEFKRVADTMWAYIAEEK